MTIQEAIQKSGTFFAMSKGSIKKAESLLISEEKVLTAAVVNIAVFPSFDELVPNLKIKNKLNGVLVVTTLRLLFCYSVLGIGQTKQIPIAAIQSVDTTATFGGFSALRIVGLTEMFIVDGLENLHTNITMAIQQAQVQSTTHKAANTLTMTFSVADELTKIKNLLDSGAITQEEFDTMKKQLLGI